MTQELQKDAGETRHRRKRWFRRFARNRDGATVIEFALLAFPFTLLVFAILESCISFAGEEYLQNVTDDLARELRTNNLPDDAPSPMTVEYFQDRMCERLEILVSTGCPGLSIDLRNFTTFAQAAALRTRIVDKEISLDGGFQFNPGGAETINTLRVFYRWPVLTDIMRSRMAGLNNGAALHFATATWQNEPYDE